MCSYGIHISSTDQWVFLTSAILEYLLDSTTETGETLWPWLERHVPVLPSSLVHFTSFNLFFLKPCLFQHVVKELQGEWSVHQEGWRWGPDDRAAQLLPNLSGSFWCMTMLSPHVAGIRQQLQGAKASDAKGWPALGPRGALDLWHYCIPCSHLVPQIGALIQL